ncbi:carbohydrate sulfotransferase 11-like [Physella acuta]|uniref:carbohydrate sulfotransferase 11-like n=1 Tax=Physella acuta TaxID=109671 RepID=UPI0027DD64BA|nr:carbohydrate sulfotransferase 11-like [Physella acuta]
MNVTSITEEFNQRNQRVAQACQSHWAINLGHKFRTWSILFDKNRRAVYCHAPKAGCTFWLRIFSFINLHSQMKELGIRSPFEIDRIKVHNGELTPHGGGANWTSFKNAFHSFAKRFIFTRDPYARLWSVYLDKYYLPDFWNRYELSQDICVTNISFSDFLALAMSSNEAHVRTIASMCNPCEFNPHFIGKVETFTRDARHILEAVSYRKLIDNYDFINYTITELKSISSNYYFIYDNEKLERCLSKKDLARRMWLVFQHNGHIKTSTPFPEGLSDYTNTTMESVLTDLVLTDPIGKDESHAQRRASLVQAYNGVEPRLIRAIQEKFRIDFEMFDYDIRPPV